MPVFDVYSQAPSAWRRVPGARVVRRTHFGYLRNLADKQGLPRSQVARVRQIGAAYGMVVNQRAPLEIAALTFLPFAFVRSPAARWPSALIYHRRRTRPRGGSS